MKRQPIISVLGHVDHGKCVTGDTLIFLKSGKTQNISELYKEYKNKSRLLIDEDGSALELKENLFVMGEDNGKIKPLVVSHIWKLKKKNLVEIKLQNGFSIKTTPEHPFPILDKNTTIIYKQSKDITDEDFLWVPNKISIQKKNLAHIKSQILIKLSKHNRFVAKVKEPLSNRIKQLEIKIKQTIPHYQDSIKKNRFRLQQLVKLSKSLEIPLDNLYDQIDNIKQSDTKQRAGHTSHYIKLPKTEPDFKDLFYVVGLLFGDGTAQGCILHNNDKQTLNFYKKFIKKVLKRPSLICKGRTCYQTKGKTWNRFLEDCFEFPIKQKSHSLVFPEILTLVSDDYLKKFIQGYLDTDGYVDLNNGVEAVSVSQPFIKNLAYSFSRFGILAQTYKTKNAYKVRLSGSHNINNFSEKINFKLERKIKQLDNYNRITTSNRITDKFPISGEQIKALRNKIGLNATEINIPYQKTYETYTTLTKSYLEQFIEKVSKLTQKNEFENNLTKKILLLKFIENSKTYREIYSKGLFKHRKLLNVLHYLESENFIIKQKTDYVATQEGKNIVKNWKNFLKYKTLQIFENIKFLVESDLNFVKVKSINLLENKDEFVYDLTQPKTHNFVANGFLIHNTKILDAIRGTTLADREAGKITQHIGATEVPLQTINQISGKLLEKFGFKLEIPGLLFIDTPGHEAFTSLRKRGGSISDLAILVIDINQGFQNQTIEAIEILRSYKTPFIVAANKIDKLGFWDSKEGSFLVNEKNQSESSKMEMDKKLYGIVGKLFEHKFQSERFDRCKDFKKQIPIIPCSAITKEGLPEIIMLLSGLSQKFLEEKIELNKSNYPEATVLEVREEKGLGTTIDVILYNGILKKGESILVGSKSGVTQTKIRALLKPKPLQEIRDKKSIFSHFNEAHAACGVKISAPNLEDVLPGAPLKIDNAQNEAAIRDEILSVKIIGETGIILKADTLGSLEALHYLAEGHKLKIKKGDLGKITKQDVIEAKSIAEKNKYFGVIFAFNTEVEPVAKELSDKENVKIFKGNVIYKILEDYQEWAELEKEREKKELLLQVPFPCKFKILKNFIFRRSAPAVFGAKIVEGELKAGAKVISESSTELGRVVKIESNNKTVDFAKKDEEVAVSIEKATLGRNLKLEEKIYTYIPSNQKAKILATLELTDEEKKLLDEIIQLNKEEED